LYNEENETIKQQAQKVKEEEAKKKTEEKQEIHYLGGGEL